jgi:hypothetical protein
MKNDIVGCLRDREVEVDQLPLRETGFTRGA